MQTKRHGPGAKRNQSGSSRSAPPVGAWGFLKASGGGGGRKFGGERARSAGPGMHELFAQQTRAMLDRTDLNEEEKQNILVAMSCPCCGAGGLSFTAKIKRRS